MMSTAATLSGSAAAGAGSAAAGADSAGAVVAAGVLVPPVVPEPPPHAASEPIIVMANIKLSHFFMFKPPKDLLNFTDIMHFKKYNCNRFEIKNK
jgi:hypothetical protein